MKAIIAGFMRGGTHSLEKQLIKEGYEVIRLDQLVYRQGLDIPKLLRHYYGDVPVFFITRIDTLEHIEAIKRVQKRRKLRLLTTKDVENMISRKHIESFKKHFSDVRVLYLEDMKMDYWQERTTSFQKFLDLLPIQFLYWWRKINQV